MLHESLSWGGIPVRRARRKVGNRGNGTSAMGRLHRRSAMPHDRRRDRGEFELKGLEGKWRLYSVND